MNKKTCAFIDGPWNVPYVYFRDYFRNNYYQYYRLDYSKNVWVPVVKGSMDIPNSTEQGYSFWSLKKEY